MTVNGKPARQARRDRDYGIVFQDAVLYDWRTVAKNIALPLELAGWNRARRQERVGEMLELVELTGFESRYPWQLSGGMQQRVSIARALSFSPALLLMDEPFGALDEMTRERLNGELLQIWDETGCTVVFVTHSIAEAVFLSTRVVVMSPRPGRIAQIVEVDLPHPRTQDTREDARFFELVTEVREALHGGSGRPAPRAERGGRPLSATSPVPAAPVAGEALLGRTMRGLRGWIPAVIVFVLGIALWEGYVKAFDVQRFLLPPPSDIAQTFWDERAVLWHAGWFTFKEAVGGFFIGSAAGVLAALVCARWRPLGRALMPYMIAANAVPIIAFAPITNQWFGLLNPLSKMIIAAVLCFFPVMVNTLRGLTSVRPQSLELMRSYAASDFTIFRRVRIPNSLPYLFAALKVASVLAMIGAVVGEYFGGSQEALGVQIRNSAALFRFETAWAAILVASILGIAFYLAIGFVERAVLRWERRGE